MGAKRRLRAAKIPVGNDRKIEGPEVAETTSGPDIKEVAYEQGRGIECSVAHHHHLRLEDGGGRQHFDPNPADEVAGWLGGAPAGPLLVNSLRRVSCEVKDIW